MLKVEVYLPEEALEKIKDVIKDYCIVRTDKYTHCMSWYKIDSMWMPINDANPFLGEIGKDTCSNEYVLIFRCEEGDLEEVLRLIKDNHPYEEVCIDVQKLLF